MLPLDRAREQLAERPRLRVRELPAERDEHVQPLLAGRLRVAREPDRVAEVVQRAREPHHVRERRVLRVEVHDAPVRAVERPGAARVDVDGDDPEVRDPGEPVGVVHEEVIEVPAVVVAGSSPCAASPGATSGASFW